MIVPVVRFKDDKRPKKVACNAAIPLCFVKKFSAGAIKSLAKIGINTIEDLHMETKENITDKIRNRNLKKEILATKERIATRAKVKRQLIAFEHFAMNKNIRIKKDQRAFLIAISLFKEIINDIEQVIDYVLETKKTNIPFREMATRKKLAETSKNVIAKLAA